MSSDLAGIPALQGGEEVNNPVGGAPRTAREGVADILVTLMQQDGRTGSYVVVRRDPQAPTVAFGPFGELETLSFLEEVRQWQEAEPEFADITHDIIPLKDREC